MIEKTIEEKIEEAISEVKDAMLENISASKAETDAGVRKTKARYALTKAKERLYSLEVELKAI